MSKIERVVPQTDLMYAPGEGIFSLVGPMIIENG